MDFPRQDARRYSEIKYRIAIIELLGNVFFLSIYQFSGFSILIANWARDFSSSFFLQFSFYLVLFGVFSYVLFLPINFYSSFILEHRFGLAKITLKGWLVRELKGVVLSAFLSFLLMQALYMVLRFVREWVLVASFGWVLVSVFLARIFPTLIVPIFYKTTPIENAALFERLSLLCKKTRLNILGIFRVGLGKETRKANAALTGIGNSRRVLLSDTLLENFSDDEIEAVLAHELGHYHHMHIRKFLIISAIGSLVAFSIVDMALTKWVGMLGLLGIWDFAVFPLFMLSLLFIGLVGLPIQNAISCHFEWQADRYALNYSTKASAFALALEKLKDLNLADPNPPKWAQVLFFDHPPINQRIKAAEEFSKPATS
jgi:STE24 endopeptidase